MDGWKNDERTKQSGTHVLGGFPYAMGFYNDHCGRLWLSVVQLSKLWGHSTFLVAGPLSTDLGFFSLLWMISEFADVCHRLNQFVYVSHSVK
jgi:hypothetical protein